MSTVEQLLLSSQISDHPLEVKTHFLMLEVPNKQGQARYRCLTCNHEFRCTGKVRLIQHITGDKGARAKHVKACPSPFLPLKENLIKRQQKEEKILSLQMQHQMKREMLKNREVEGNGDGDGDGEGSEEEILVDSSSRKMSEEDEENEVVIGAYVHPMMLSSSEDGTAQSSCRVTTAPSRKQTKKSAQPKGRKRSHPSSSTPSYPTKKPSQPPANYLISNERLMSLIRRMYSIVPDVVQKAIVLESLADRAIAAEEEVTPSTVPSWVSSLYSSFITSSPASVESNVSLPNASALSAEQIMVPNVFSLLYGIPNNVGFTDYKEAISFDTESNRASNQSQSHHHQVQLTELMQRLAESYNH